MEAQLGGLADALAAKLAASAPPGTEWTLDQVRTALATALQGLPDSAQRADLEANLETGAARMHAQLSTALGAKRPRSAGQDGEADEEPAPASLATPAGYQAAVAAACAEGSAVPLDALCALCHARAPCPPELLAAACARLDSGAALQLCSGVASGAGSPGEAAAAFLPVARRAVELAGEEGARLAGAAMAALGPCLARQRLAPSGGGSGTPAGAVEAAGAEARAGEACAALVLARLAAAAGGEGSPAAAAHLDADLALLAPWALLGTLRGLAPDAAPLPPARALALTAAVVRAGHGGCVEAYLRTLVAARRARHAGTHASGDGAEAATRARVAEAAARAAPPPALAGWLAEQPPSAAVVSAREALEADPLRVGPHLLQEAGQGALEALAAAAQAWGGEPGEERAAAAAELAFFVSTERDPALCVTDSDEEGRGEEEEEQESEASEGEEAVAAGDAKAEEQESEDE
ncbi:hypothetical protein ACKKBG_A25480 [Auxenochlorella protothecoides x Auxenochlorella symbiontica]